VKERMKNEAKIRQIIDSMIKWAEKQLKCKNNGECGIQIGKYADGRDKATFYFDGSFFDCFSWDSYIPKLFYQFEEQFKDKIDKIGYSMEHECAGRITIYESF
jgi:hypothetical protein